MPLIQSSPDHKHHHNGHKDAAAIEHVPEHAASNKAASTGMNATALPPFWGTFTVANGDVRGVVRVPAGAASIVAVVGTANTPVFVFSTYDNSLVDIWYAAPAPGAANTTPVNLGEYYVTASYALAAPYPDVPENGTLNVGS